VHQNYVGTDGDKAPFFLSVVLTDANNQYVPQYRAILWKKTVGSVSCLGGSTLQGKNDCDVTATLCMSPNPPQLSNSREV
jgi:hypothetical protein